MLGHESSRDLTPDQREQYEAFKRAVYAFVEKACMVHYQAPTGAEKLPLVVEELGAVNRAFVAFLNCPKYAEGFISASLYRLLIDMLEKADFTCC